MSYCGRADCHIDGTHIHTTDTSIEGLRLAEENVNLRAERDEALEALREVWERYLGSDDPVPPKLAQSIRTLLARYPTPSKEKP